MVNIIAPSAIILCNNDLTPNVLAALQRQLYINDTMDGYEFDLRIANDPNYVDVIHANDLRVLVIRPFTEFNNRDKFDIVLWCAFGLVSVEENRFGIPRHTFAIDRCYLSQLFLTK